MLALPGPDDIPLATAAHRIGVPYPKAYHELLIGNLSGRRIGGRWYVDRLCVEQIEAENSARRSA